MLEAITLHHILVAFAFVAVAFLIHEWFIEFNYKRVSKAKGCTPPPYFPSKFFGISRIWNFYQRFRVGELNEFCREQFDEFQVRTIRVQTLSRCLTATIDPENVKAILATQFKDFDLGKRYNQFQPLMGDGIFTLSGPGWQHSRALLRPQFATEEISRLHDIEIQCQVLIDVIKEKSAGRYLKGQSGDGTFDLQELFFKLTLDTATEFLFGESTECLSQGKRLSSDRYKEAEQFAEQFNLGQTWLLRRAMAQGLYKLLAPPSYFKAAEVCHKFVDYYVEQALKTADVSDEKAEKEGQKKYYFLRELTKETRDPVLMRDQAINILLAGRDTTAGLLSFTFALLIRNKDVWHKLREAVLADFGTSNENITFHTLKRCEYLKWVMNEVLRLYPSVPVNFRTATRDTTLPRGGGPDESQPVYIKKGTDVFYATFCLHRDKGLWGEDAAEFRPERWADSKAGSAWKYIPFNGGPRICLGQQFALTEAGYVITRLAQSFKDVTSTPEQLREPIRQQSTLTSSVFNGVHVWFEPA